MEPNNYRNQRYGPDRTDGWRAHGGLVPGVILVGIGALFFLNNLHIAVFQDWVRFWPVILIAVGIVKLVDSQYPGGRVAGGVLVGVGGVLLAQSLGFLDVRMHDLWPLWLIGLGVVLLFQRTLPWADAWGNRAGSGGSLNGFALFGGGKRNVNTQNFEGGRIDACFGGFEIDLRRAEMQGNSATLQINAVFGGVEVKIPTDWAAVVQGIGVFGGYVDSTIQPIEPRTTEPKKLYLTGAAVFGGVEIKN